MTSGYAPERGHDQAVNTDRRYHCYCTMISGFAPERGRDRAVDTDRRHHCYCTMISGPHPLNATRHNTGCQVVVQKVPSSTVIAQVPFRHVNSFDNGAIIRKCAIVSSRVFSHDRNFFRGFIRPAQFPVCRETSLTSTPLICWMVLADFFLEHNVQWDVRRRFCRTTTGIPCSTTRWLHRHDRWTRIRRA